MKQTLHGRDREKGVIEMAAEGNSFAKFMGFLTLAICVAALVEPRVRKFCLSLLCKL